MDTLSPCLSWNWLQKWPEYPFWFSSAWLPNISSNSSFASRFPEIDNINLDSSQIEKLRKIREESFSANMVCEYLKPETKDKFIELFWEISFLEFFTIYFKLLNKVSGYNEKPWIFSIKCRISNINNIVIAFTNLSVWPEECIRKIINNNNFIDFLDATWEILAEKKETI